MNVCLYVCLIVCVNVCVNVCVLIPLTIRSKRGCFYMWMNPMFISEHNCPPEITRSWKRTMKRTIMVATQMWTQFIKTSEMHVFNRIWPFTRLLPCARIWELNVFISGERWSQNLHYNFIFRSRRHFCQLFGHMHFLY